MPQAPALEEDDLFDWLNQMQFPGECNRYTLLFKSLLNYSCCNLMLFSQISYPPYSLFCPISHSPHHHPQAHLKICNNPTSTTTLYLWTFNLLKPNLCLWPSKHLLFNLNLLKPNLCIWPSKHLLFNLNRLKPNLCIWPSKHLPSFPTRPSLSLPRLSLCLPPLLLDMALTLSMKASRPFTTKSVVYFWSCVCSVL